MDDFVYRPVNKLKEIRMSKSNNKMLAYAVDTLKMPFTAHAYLSNDFQADPDVSKKAANKKLWRTYAVPLLAGAALGMATVSAGLTLTTLFAAAAGAYIVDAVSMYCAAKTSMDSINTSKNDIHDVLFPSAAKHKKIPQVASPMPPA
jgi:hypothetical protein